MLISYFNLFSSSAESALLIYPFLFIFKFKHYYSPSVFLMEELGSLFSLSFSLLFLGKTFLKAEDCPSNYFILYLLTITLSYEEIPTPSTTVSLREIDSKLILYKVRFFFNWGNWLLRGFYDAWEDMSRIRYLFISI